jgi:hypothetical protein
LPNLFHLFILNDGSYNGSDLRLAFEQRFQARAIALELGVILQQLHDVIEAIPLSGVDAIILAIGDDRLRRDARSLIEDRGCEITLLDAIDLDIEKIESAQPQACAVESKRFAELIQAIDKNQSKAWTELLREVQVSRETIVKASDAVGAMRTIEDRVKALSRDVSRLDETISDLRDVDTKILLRDDDAGWLGSIAENRTQIILGLFASCALYLIGTSSLLWLGVISESQAKSALRFPLEIIGVVKDAEDD